MILHSNCRAILFVSSGYVFRLGSVHTTSACDSAAGEDALRARTFTRVFQ